MEDIFRVSMKAHYQNWQFATPYDYETKHF